MSIQYLKIDADNVIVNPAPSQALLISNPINGEYCRIFNASSSIVPIGCENNKVPLTVNGQTGQTSFQMHPGDSAYVYCYWDNVGNSQAYFVDISLNSSEGYTLPPATASAIGGVSVANTSGLSVTAQGALSVASATPTQLGGVKVAVNSGISLSSGFISLNAGAGLNVDGTTGAVSIAAAQAGALGGVEIPANSGLTNTGGALSVAPATAALVGGVKVPATGGLAVAGDGSLSYTGQGTPFATYKEFITSASAYTAAQQIFAEYQPVAWTLPVNGGTSKFGAVNAAGSATTTTSTVNIQKNGVTVGTLSYAAGAAGATVVATITIASAVSFAVGDLLSLVVGATPDANFVNVFGTFIGTHN